MARNISYSCGVSSEPLLGLTIGQAFDLSVDRYPDNEAIVSRHQNIRFSYKELQYHVNRCSKSLMYLGLVKGDRVGIWSPNCAEWLITQIATAKLGIILVNINPSYRLNELEYALDQSGCRALILADKFKSSDYTGMISALVPENPNDKLKTLKCQKLPKLEWLISLGTETSAKMHLWKEFVNLGDRIPLEDLMAIQDALSFDEPINIQYTSGTTGYPKGATLSHHNILNNGHLVAKIQKFTNKDRLVIPVPLYHCFGMVMGNLGCITHGATMIYPGASFDPLAVLEAVQEEKATALYGVPTMFFAELNHPEFRSFNVSTLRTGVMAGSLCPSALMRRVNDEMNMTEVEIAYGMTETSPVSTQTRHDAPFEKRVNTVGSIMPHTEIKIVNPDTGQTVPIGEKGELCTRGYCVMLGYWNDPEKTAESIDAARWMHTGDLATMDEDGYISIVGRIKDMIIRGGENVYPKEIEEFLSRHPEIMNVQVIGIPDIKYGEEICAWVQLSTQSSLTEVHIKDYCKGQIAHFKIPKMVKFVDEFPMTVTGKIRKVEMRRITIEEFSNS